MQGTWPVGLPDVDLAGAAGRVNPSDFAGHEVVLMFCPADRRQAARELADYNARADALAYNDAFMVAVCDPQVGQPASRIAIACDAGRAWEALGKWRERNARVSPEDGLTFLFGRGGTLRKVWSGAGHASEVMQALEERM